MRLAPIALVFLVACGGGGSNNTPPAPAKTWKYTDPPADATHWRVVKGDQTPNSITLHLESPGETKEVRGFVATWSVSGSNSTALALEPGKWPSDALVTKPSNTAIGAVVTGSRSVSYTKQNLLSIRVTLGAGPVDLKLVRFSLVYVGGGVVSQESVNMGTISYE